MTNILVSDANPETQELLVKCLETAGFQVMITENGAVHVHRTNQKFPTTLEPQKPNNPRNFIFPSIPRLKEVFEFIELNYHHNISLKQVADSVGYSSAYLTDLVRRLTGKTVNNWIIERRIAQACTLLLETNYSVEKIALDIGYQNINHFYCQFRNYYQNTPRVWRDKQRVHILSGT
ncbi:MAG: helix-turn-helix transcriptional regulator [Calothrix sp. C42_A2020_038]|nr:helix-turn-helix transcriptional regulator [Calothrix sp. C42_A2020_038]